MNKESKIYIAGHKGLAGSAILRKLISEGYTNLIYRSSNELDLRNQLAVNSFFNNEKPEYVFFAAGKVGGIMANKTYPGEFIYDNLQMISNTLHAAKEHRVKKLLYLGSSCIYPRESAQPMKEEYLLSGKLEETNKPYALAKLAGIGMCQAYNNQYGMNNICLIPTNLFGINDNYHPINSHLVAALIKKFHEAKIQNLPLVELWGTGTPRREILDSDQLADACIFFMLNYKGNEVINIGVGIDYSIFEIAEIIKSITDYKGKLIFDSSKPDGTMKKLLDISKAEALGWRYNGELFIELSKAYINFKEIYNN